MYKVPPEIAVADSGRTGIDRNATKPLDARPLPAPLRRPRPTAVISATAGERAPCCPPSSDPRK